MRILSLLLSFLLSFSLVFTPPVQAGFIGSSIHGDGFYRKAGFKPSEIDNLLLWYRADAGVTKDGSDDVTNLADQTTNDHDLTNGTNKPRWFNTSQEGAGFSSNIIQLASNESLEATSRDVIGGYSQIDIYMAFARRSAGVGLATPKLLWISTDNSANPRISISGDTSNPPNIELNTRRLDADATSTLSDTTQSMVLSDAYIYQFAVDYSLAVREIFKNGSLVVSDDGVVSKGLTQATSSALLALGGSTVSDTNIELTELLIYGHKLPDIQRTQIHSYLEGRHYAENGSYHAQSGLAARWFLMIDGNSRTTGGWGSSWPGELYDLLGNNPKFAYENYGFSGGRYCDTASGFWMEEDAYVDDNGNDGLHLVDLDKLYPHTKGSRYYLVFAGTNDIGGHGSTATDTYNCLLSHVTDINSSGVYDGIFVAKEIPREGFIGTSVITNFHFNTDISGWTDTSSGTGSIAWNAAGHVDLIGGGVGNEARAEAVLTDLPAKTYGYGLNVDNTGGVINVKVGTTSGASDVLNTTVNGTEKHVYFNNATQRTLYVTLENPNSDTRTADDTRLSNATNNILVEFNDLLDTNKTALEAVGLTKFVDLDDSASFNDFSINGSHTNASIYSGDQLHLVAGGNAAVATQVKSDLDEYILKGIQEPFIPSALSGLVLWLEAGSGTELDGSNVLENWRDLSGKDNDGNQSNSAQRLEVTKTDTNAVDGLAVIRGDGTNDRGIDIAHDATDFANLGDEVSFYIALRSDPTQATLRWPVAKGNPVSAKGFLLQNVDASGNQRLLVNDGTMNVVTDSNTFQPFNGNWNVASYRIEKGKATFNMNGGTKFEKTWTSNGDFGNTNPLALMESNGGEWKGDVAGFLMFNRKLSDEEDADVQTYLMDLVGIDWKPSNLTGLEGWWEANEYQNTITSGDVETLKDLSGNGNDLTQATSTRRPTPTSGDISNQQSLEFDSTDFLGIATGFSTSSYTKFLVYKPTGFTGTSNLFSSDGSGSFPHALYFSGTGTSVNFYHGAIVVTSSRTSVVGETEALIAIYDDTNDTVQLRQNGTETADGSAPNNNTSTAIRLGAFVTPPGEMNFGVAGFYNRVLDHYEIQLLERWLGRRFGITID